MENTKTKMTKQEKKEVMDTMSKIMEQEQKEFKEMHDAFVEQHDWLADPDVQTKSVAASVRKNILLQAWNKFINCEAKMAEFAGWEREGKGFRTFYGRRTCDVALDFAHFFLAWAEEDVKYINEHIEESDK